MRKFTVLALALLGVLLVATSGAIAHGDGDSTHTGTAENSTATEQASWMEQHMTERMGAEAAQRMQERMGMSYAEMEERMASRDSTMGGMGCH